MNKLSRVIIIHPEGNSFNNPTMKSVIDLLRDHDVSITLMHSKTVAPMPGYRGIEFISWRHWWRIIKILALKRLSSALLSYLTSYIECIIHELKKNDIIIGVDREGLIQAYYMSRILKIPYVFISYEIIFENETSTQFKKLERLASTRVSHWFVQDALRRDLLIEENRLTKDNCSIIPLASRGLGVISDRRLRDDIGVPKDSKVAILMGSLSDWVMTDEVLETLHLWPADWKLIIHSRYGGTSNHFAKRYTQFKQLVQKKIYLSDISPGKVDELDYILSGVDAGLAFYKPTFTNSHTGKNIAYLGLASGKIATFLRYGTPVIMNEIGVYADLAREHGFGCCVKEATELPRILLNLDYNKMRVAARKFYVSKLDFKLYESMVWNDLCNANNKMLA